MILTLLARFSRSDGLGGDAGLAQPGCTCCAAAALDAINNPPRFAGRRSSDCRSSSTPGSTVTPGSEMFPVGSHPAGLVESRNLQHPAKERHRSRINHIVTLLARAISVAWPIKPNPVTSVHA